MRFIVILLAMCALSFSQISCKTGPVLAPEAEEPQTPTPEPTPAPTPTATPKPTPAPGLKIGLADIQNVALGSKCAKYSFPHRQGLPPSRYLRGIALTYAKGYCDQNAEWVKVASQPVGLATKDALAHYAKELAALELDNDTPRERFRHTFSLLVGSNSVESSWRWCVGRDVNAKESDVKECLYGTGKTCEAGMSQWSKNILVAHPVLAALFTKYQGTTAGCFAAEYKGGTTCTEANLKNHGSEKASLDFQRISKDCPGFSAEGHAVALRVVRTHFGPINNKMAKLTGECDRMFWDIEALVESHPGVCSLLK